MAKTHQGMVERMAEDDALQIVARNGSFMWTRLELSDLFRRVQPQEHWKNPIDAVATLANDRELLGLREAIIFYTGSVPTLASLGANQYRVRAAGYYATIGA